jgi:hypothetical protein
MSARRQRSAGPPGTPTVEPGPPRRAVAGPPGATGPVAICRPPRPSAPRRPRRMRGGGTRGDGGAVDLVGAAA